MQQYLKDIDGLIVYTTMTKQYLLNIILNYITSQVGQAMTHNNDLHSNQSN